MRALFALSLLLAVSACDFASLLAPPVEEDTPPRRRTSDECEDDDDCRGGEFCDDGECAEIAEGEGEPSEGEGEGELPGEGEGEGELPGEGEGEGELPGEGEGEPSSGDVTIELTWSSTAPERDLDLHLTRASPPTFCTADDCNWRNRTSTWGAVMEADDINGAGTERIRLAANTPGTFTAAVATYNTTGPITARVVVSQGGRTVFERSSDLDYATLWVPVSMRFVDGTLSTTLQDTRPRVTGDCLGDASTSTASYGEPCTDAADCRAGLLCGVVGFSRICTNSCMGADDCEECSAETGNNCTCGTTFFMCEP